MGICLERTPALLVGMLGVLKAGAAYLPLDPETPPARLRFMLKDSRAEVVLTEERLAARLAGADVRMFCLDRDWPAIAAAGAAVPGASGVGAGHLAYVIYTSGSTGQPKGVLVEHRGLANLTSLASAGACGDGRRPVATSAGCRSTSSVWSLALPARRGAVHLASRAAAMDGAAGWRGSATERNHAAGHADAAGG